MRKKTLIGAIVIVLLFGLIGYLVASSGSEQTTTQPTTPTQPTLIPGIIEVTAEELIQQLVVDPNKYPRGTIIQVSGKLDMAMTIDMSKLAYFLKPTSAKTEYFVILLVENFRDEDWLNVSTTSEVIIRGEYDGFYEVKTGNSSVSGKGPVFTKPVLISSSK